MEACGKSKCQEIALPKLTRPQTKTITGPGHTYVTTVTEVSTVVEKVPTKIIETVPGPTVIEKTKEIEYTTITSLIPHVSLKAIFGNTAIF